MLFSKLFKTNVVFPMPTRNEIIVAKKSLYLNYLNLYIDGSLVFTSVNGLNSFFEFENCRHKPSKEYRELLKSEILIWCKRNNYTCATDLNCCGYESLSDIYYCQKDGEKIVISVVIGTHFSSRDKAHIFAEMIDMKEISGVFEKGQFVY
ncbi:hypothetical protein [Clostridium disporicum]|uniref:hypothetical protein n=1 Tax=Clostridium disporicum TaxID=84024 RepID=UPI0034A3C1C1